MKTIVLITLLILFVGCGKYAERQYDEFNCGDVLMRIGDKEYTKRECERDAAFIAAQKNRGKNNSKESVVSLKERRIACGNFISACAVEKALGEKFNKSIPTIDERRITRLSREFKMSVEDVRKCLKNRAVRSVNLSRYVSVVVSNRHPVTSAEIDFVSNRIKKNNIHAAATNKFVYALATNVYNKIINGGDFERLAAKYDQEPVHGGPGEWGTIRAIWFQDEPEFLNVLRKTPVGGVTPPVEADEGLMIVKVLEQSGTEPKNEDEESTKQYNLKRIYFRLPVFFKEETDEEIKRGIHMLKCKDLAKKIVDSVIKEVDVEYPCGKIIWNTKNNQEQGEKQ